MKVTDPVEHELEAIRAEQELLPCPFCGGEARKRFDDWVGCSDCAGRAWGRTEDEAVKAWNARHG